MITETLLSPITQLDIFSKSPDILVPCLHIWCVLSCVDMDLQCVLKFDNKKKKRNWFTNVPQRIAHVIRDKVIVTLYKWYCINYLRHINLTGVQAKLNNLSIVYVPKL